MGAMPLLFTAHHTQQHVPTEGEHTLGKGGNDTDNVLRAKGLDYSGVTGGSQYLHMGQ